MQHRRLSFVLTAAALVIMAAAPAHAQSSARYRVTITNLTKGQTFTPILIATHAPSHLIFAPGTQASPQLQVLAEEGATDLLATLLRGMPAN
ncbi:MAG TPA: spondin domain-containing protein, partial [Vicinamibacterales bacterium]|nr:spondin domain-containing protein [Vicinamibacterales bacterium]